MKFKTVFTPLLSGTRYASSALDLAPRPSVPAKNRTRTTTPETLDERSAYDDDDLTVIETPKGSQNKYTYQARFGAFVLRGIVSVGAVFRSISASCPRRWERTAIRWTSWS